MENYFEPCLAPDQLRAMSSIGLAHIGDAVFEILARTWLCAHGRATGRGNRLSSQDSTIAKETSSAYRAIRFPIPASYPALASKPGAPPPSMWMMSLWGRQTMDSPL